MSSISPTPNTPAPLLRNGPAVWKHIAATLEREIRERHYADQGCLPSEPELAARFQVARHTLRLALASLRKQGVLRVEHGRGAFIQTTSLDYTLQRHTRFTQIISGQAKQPERQLLSSRIVKASTPVAQGLAIRKGAQVVVAEMLLLEGEQPLGLAMMYFPAERLGALQERLLNGEGVSAALANLGIVDYHRVHNTITAHLPDKSQAQMLGQPIEQPVLSVESIDADENGVPIKYGITIFSADRVNLKVSLNES